MIMKSLKSESNPLSNSAEQLKVLSNSKVASLTEFKDKLSLTGLYPLKATGIDIFQMNIGKMCNQVCKHCHVDAGPDRKEIMTRETMQQCLETLASNPSIG